jgi:protocatechuate 3,4-dioxygenase beta subunit
MWNLTIEEPTVLDAGAGLGRRRLLSLLAGAGLVTLVGCGSDDGGSSAGATTDTTGASSGDGSTAATPGSTPVSDASITTASGGTDASCATIPTETGGPYPADGTNGPNVLTQDGVVRKDIRSSFGTSTTVAEGVPLTITLSIKDASNGCAALAGAAVYLWHCDRDGAYSLYSQGVTGENYLRGVQEADETGVVTFDTIFPACYSGRWPHVHFEVFPTLSDTTSGSGRPTTSQLALPEDTCALVFATSGYEKSVSNLTQVSLGRDNVFSDGWDQEMATLSGSVADGFVAMLDVVV